ncbi:MAG: hypothetical protein M1383_05575 [Patescibacteria group bacterium]|nr:hypothetical protein [Patescibacteria group bacterium]
MKLLLGTHNKTKLNHYKKFLTGTKIELVYLNDLGITEEPEETGETTEDNAILKAKFYQKKSGLPTLADDAGFEILALNNWPGIHANRLNGDRSTDQKIMRTILDKMANLKGQDRKAKMKVALALALGNGDTKIALGEITGIVPETPYEKLEEHFPYRSLLFVTKLNKWFYEINEIQEDELGFRRAALEKLMPYLTK